MRLALRIYRIENNIAFMDMHLNGARISGNCGMSVRLAELVDFLLRIKPDRVEVDREMISEDLYHRLRAFESVRFA